jgi:hypothetical protein
MASRPTKLLVLCLISGILALSAPPAEAASSYAKVFYYDDNSYIDSDASITFSAQVTYTSGGRPFVSYPLAWVWSLAPAIRAIGTGTMGCSAHLNRNGVVTPWHDNHPSLPLTYLWHASVPINDIGAAYVLAGSCTFRVSVGGRLGTAVVSWTFDYVVSDGAVRSARRASSDRSNSLYVSTAKIVWAG